ncbi:MAG: GTP 3',8-cyclase MoaA [Candidatus Omnitrophica bacterium]|nr:GTP 3',8-cyclase MoaA [Candidatus Omnitrophota bacterium]
MGHSITDQFNRPLRDLRISVIDRCNFRCPYCMPDEQFSHTYQFLDKDQWLTFEEIFRLVRIFVSLGVEKVRLTGGEPLLRPHMDELVKNLSMIEGIKDLALTTNGSLLGGYAVQLKKAGLKRLTISLDSLDPQVFKTLSGAKGRVEQILDGIKVAEAVGFKQMKINAVIQRGVNDHTVLDLVRFFRGSGHTLRFIEYMDVGNQNHWDLTQVVPSREIIAKIHKIYPLESIGGTEGGGTSQRYRFIDGQEEIGFISSVSQPFCGTCNRLRLSADGKMYTCLFATQGTDLREHLRNGASDDFLAHLIRVVWMKREDRYSELRSQIHQTHRPMHKVEMYQIGG